MGAKESAGSGESRPRAIGSGRSGPIRSALRRVLTEARDSQRMTSEHELRAMLAERYAALADQASAAGDGPGFVRASERLLSALAALPVREPGGGASDDGDAGGAVLKLFDGGPEMGDAAHA